MQDRNDPTKRRTAKDPIDAESPLRRFEQSMIMDYEKWHDGIGYDLNALREASPSERETIEKILMRAAQRIGVILKHSPF